MNHKPPRTVVDEILLLAHRAGFADKLAGRPYPTEYETWSMDQQRNYENGRLRAAEERQLIAS